MKKAAAAAADGLEKNGRGAGVAYVGVGSDAMSAGTSVFELAYSVRGRALRRRPGRGGRPWLAFRRNACVAKKKKRTHLGRGRRFRLPHVAALALCRLMGTAIVRGCVGHGVCGRACCGAPGARSPAQVESEERSRSAAAGRRGSSLLASGHNFFPRPRKTALLLPPTKTTPSLPPNRWACAQVRFRPLGGSGVGAEALSDPREARFCSALANEH